MVLTCGCQTIGLSYPILLPLPRGYAIAPSFLPLLLVAHRDQHSSRDDEEYSCNGHKRQRLPEHHRGEKRDARNRTRVEHRMRDMQQESPECRRVEYERHSAEEEHCPRILKGWRLPWRHHGDFDEHACADIRGDEVRAALNLMALAMAENYRLAL